MSARASIPIFLFVAVSLIAGATGPVLPSEVEPLIAEAQTIMQRFQTQTAAARLTWLCLDRFQDPEQKRRLYTEAANDYGELLRLLDLQRRHLDAIEAYEGADWEMLYGETRLWARLDQTFRITGCRLNRILFWKTLSGAEALSSDQLDKPVENQLAAESPWQDRDDPLRLWKEFQNPGLAARYAARFAEKTNRKSDYEWCLVYAFRDFRGGHARSLKTFSAAWPEVTPFLSRLLLDWLHEQFQKDGPRILETQDGFALSLACRAAGDDPRPEPYLAFLKAVSAVCQEPAVPLALGRALASSYPSNALLYASKAVELALENRPISAEARQTADEALRLVCALAQQKKIQNPEAVLSVLDRYFSRVQEGTDPEIILAAADIYATNQKPDPAKKRLESLLQGHPSHADEARRRLMLIDLDRLLADPRESGDLLPRVAAILSGLPEPRLRDDQVEKLSDVMDRFLWECETGSVDAALMEKALAVSEAAMRSGRPRAELLWVELSCLRGAGADEWKTAVRAILDKYKGDVSPSYRRALARAQMVEGDWTAALQTWQDLRSLIPGPASPRWWQCRYYELFCYSRLPGVSREELTRAVEVLLATYPAAPTEWKTRLRAL